MRRTAELAILLSALMLAACATVAPKHARPSASGMPVVLVHGIWDTAAAFSRMAASLSAAGWVCHAVSLRPNDGSASLGELAEQLRRFIDGELGPQTPFDLVGFSMGGLVARYYAQRLGGLDRLQHLVLISVPEHGTRAAYLGFLPGEVEMRPGSPVLADLAGDESRLTWVALTSIWSPFDLAVEPPSSSRMPFGREVVIPVLYHAWMLSDERVIDAVMEALRERPMRQ